MQKKVPSFQRQKAELPSAPFLTYPRQEGQFNVDTTPSVYSHFQDDELKVIDYLKKTMTNTE